MLWFPFLCNLITVYGNYKLLFIMYVKNVLHMRHDQRLEIMQIR